MAETKIAQYGFSYGPMEVERAFSDDKKGWAVLIIKTKKHPVGVQVYVTKTGKLRVFTEQGELKLSVPN